MLNLLIPAVQLLSWYGPPLLALVLLIAGLKARERSTLIKAAVVLAVVWPVTLVLAGMVTVGLRAWLSSQS